MKTKNKIHILFFSLITIEFIVSTTGIVIDNNFLWIGGIVAGILTAFLCMGLRFKYDSEKKEMAK